MTRTCILHIGLSKTGSSSIQRTLHRYDDGRLAYARIRDPNHSSPLFQIFCSDPARRDRPFLNWRTPADQAAVAKRHAAAFDREMTRPRDVIFSAEGICGKLTADEIGDMAARLRRHFDRVRVIAYLRPYRNACASAWQQNVKMGENRFVLPRPAFRGRLQPFIRHFGKDSVEMRPFDRAALINGDVIDDFAALIGIDPAGLRRQTVNESVSLEALSIVYAHNRFAVHPGSRAERRMSRIALVQDLADFGTQRFGFDPALVDAACKHHRADLDWASRLLGVDMAGTCPAVERPIGTEAELLALAARHRAAAEAHVRSRRASGPAVRAAQPGGVAAVPDGWSGRAAASMLGWAGRGRRAISRLAKRAVAR